MVVNIPIFFSNLSVLRVDKGYSGNVTCARNLISTIFNDDKDYAKSNLIISGELIEDQTKTENSDQKSVEEGKIAL